MDSIKLICKPICTLTKRIIQSFSFGDARHEIHLSGFIPSKINFVMNTFYLPIPAYSVRIIPHVSAQEPAL